MIYLASPYTGSQQAMQRRYEDVLHVTATLLVNKKWTFSPIVHCHEMAVRYKLPRDIDFWHKYNEAMLHQAERLYVLRLSGWLESRGVQHEMAYAEKLNIPLRYVSLTETTVSIYEAGGYGEPLSEFALIS